MLIEGLDAAFSSDLNRGDRLEPIFEDDADRQMFLKTLGETCRSAGWLSGTIRGRPEWLRRERVYGEMGLQNWRSRARRDGSVWFWRDGSEVKRRYR
jgi:hypothetical protein